MPNFAVPEMLSQNCFHRSPQAVAASARLAKLPGSPDRSSFPTVELYSRAGLTAIVAACQEISPEVGRSVGPPPTDRPSFRPSFRPRFRTRYIRECRRVFFGSDVVPNFADFGGFRRYVPLYTL